MWRSSRWRTSWINLIELLKSVAWALRCARANEHCADRPPPWGGERRRLSVARAREKGTGRGGRRGRVERGGNRGAEAGNGRWRERISPLVAEIRVV